MGQCQRPQRKIPPSHDIDGNSTTDPKIIADGLGKYIAKLAAFDTYDPVIVRQTIINSSTVPEDSVELAINQPLSFRELQYTLGRSSEKSAGPDNGGEKS